MQSGEREEDASESAGSFSSSEAISRGWPTFNHARRPIKPNKTLNAKVGAMQKAHPNPSLHSFPLLQLCGVE
jgi:hypothetical protein